MAFVKLDTGILRSTLWMDRDARECFITALLMAEPREFTEGVPQLEVRSLETTGFVAPPGWYGFVDSAGIGIVRQAGLDTEAGMDALHRLGSAEAESRSSDHGGRRLIRIDGGYLVLNFMKYRDRDYTAAERMRRYRDRKVVTRNGDDVTRNEGVTTRNVTHAEAEAEEEIRSKRGTPKKGELIPEDFALTEVQRQRVLERYPDCDIDASLEAFRAHHTAKGTKSLRWASNWVSWVGNFDRFGYPKRRVQKSPPGFERVQW